MAEKIKKFWHRITHIFDATPAKGCKCDQNWLVLTVNPNCPIHWDWR